ncbi:uncharacterized protein [Zea mays]|nr:uncharacterized protein LOC103653934 [Zea mays]
MASLHPTTAMLLAQRHSPAPSLRSQHIVALMVCLRSHLQHRVGPWPRSLLTGPASGNRQSTVVCAAWTRRSRGETEQRPNRKSWKQTCTCAPSCSIFFPSKRFVHAKVMHRGTSKVIAVATTNDAKDFRLTLPSLVDDNACRTTGRLIAERSMDADVFALAYEPKKNESREQAWHRD